MKDNTLFALCWAMVLTGVLAVIGAMLVSDIHADQTIYTMVAEGAHPIAAWCAVRGPTTEAVICLEVLRIQGE